MVSLSLLSKNWLDWKRCGRRSRQSSNGTNIFAKNYSIAVNRLDWKTMQSISHDSAELPVVEAVTKEQQPRGLLRAFIALRHRNFRLFWFGQLISLIGTWMQTTAQAWLVLELTHSAWLLGVVGALQFLPVMFLALFGGVMDACLPMRTVMLFTMSYVIIQ